MTGALIAHAFASAGVATTVLEAGGVGQGSTAASSALLLHEPDLELTELTTRYGLRASRRIWQLCRESADANACAMSAPVIPPPTTATSVL